MPQPVKKFFGNLKLEELTQAIVAVKKAEELTEYKGEKQVKIGAAQWEDGNITIDIYVKAEKKSFKIGQLRVSTLDNSTSFSPSNDLKPQANDLPF